MKTRKVIKRADNGKFGSKDFLKKHPKIAYEQTVPVKPGKKRKKQK